MAKWSNTHASAQNQPTPQPVRYDEETGRPLPPKKPRATTPTLPGSVVQYSGDDPLDLSGLRDIYDTPEARQQDPEVQKRLLAEYQQDLDSGPIPYDLSDVAREWGLDPGGYGHYEGQGRW